MNSIFSITRFFDYSLFQVMTRGKRFLFRTAALTTALVALLCFMLYNGAANHQEDWIMIIFFYFGVIMVYALVQGFAAIKEKKQAIHFLTVPTSIFEKFSFEVLNCIIMPLILFPFYMFFLTRISSLLALIMSFKWKVAPFSFQPIFDLYANPEKEPVELIVPSILFLITFLFAGVVTFKKYAGLKTVVFFVALVASCIGYFYVLMEKLQFNSGLEYLAHHLVGTGTDLETLFDWVLGFEYLSIAVFLVYVFYAFKAKEV